MQSPTTEICNVNKTMEKREEKNPHQHLMQNNWSTASMLHWWKWIRKRAIATFILCVLKYYAFYVLWCLKPNIQAHVNGRYMAYFECKVNKRPLVSLQLWLRNIWPIYIIILIGVFSFEHIRKSGKEETVSETGICIIVNA